MLKAVVAAFNQEKVLVGAFLLLRDCTTSPINRFAALVYTLHRSTGRSASVRCSDGHHCALVLAAKYRVILSAQNV